MKFEYKMLSCTTKGFTGGKFDHQEFEDCLNQFGQDGWELVNVFDTNQAQGQSRDIIGIFKRPIS